MISVSVLPREVALPGGGLTLVEGISVWIICSWYIMGGDVEGSYKPPDKKTCLHAEIGEVVRIVTVKCCASYSIFPVNPRSNYITSSVSPVQIDDATAMF